MTKTRTQSTNQNVTLNDALNKLYEDIESAPSYSAKINAYLRSNIVHSTHRRIVKKTFPRRRVIARFPFDIFMADLIEYPKLSFNKKFKMYEFCFIQNILKLYTVKISK